MINIELVLTLVSGLQRPDLERWIEDRLVLPDSAAGVYLFREIDVARIRLIRELRDDLLVNEEALPIVLSLLDQLHDARHRMREFGKAFGRTAPLEVRRGIATELTGYNDPDRRRSIE